MKLFSKRSDTELPGDARLEQGVLCINCRECTQFPEAGSPVCISCMCDAISRTGTAERIKLKATKDTEISGAAAEIICDLAKISRPVQSVPCGRGCARCNRSPDSVFETAWADFPDPSFQSACSRLYNDSRDGPECAVCMQKTYSALIAAEKEMKKIRDKVSAMCGGN